jgi:hypothetical protein
VARTQHYGDVLAGLLPQLAIGRSIGRNASVGAEAIMDPTKRRIFNRSKLVRPQCVGLLAVVAALAIICVQSIPNRASADEGGVSFWLPGQFGSLAAVPGAPGWGLGTIYYHTTVGGSADIARSREIEIGRFNPTINLNLSANLHAYGDLFLFAPSYVFATPVLGGQAAVSMATIVGHSSANVAGTLTATLPPFMLVRSDSISDSVTGFGDLYPQATLKWNRGGYNYMVYATGDIPVGAYESTRLANLGIGHGAFDGGAGYTYFNPQTGHELSAVTGFTYNFKNTSTNYENGVDWHLDWGASQFLSKQVHVGAVGYFYQQVSGDSGGSPLLRDFKSRVVGIGPQIGFLFPVGSMQGYLNVKGYKEFDEQHRPAGWNGWLTFAITPPEPTPAPPPPKRLVIHK